MIKLRIVLRAKHVARMGEVRNAWKILVEKTERKNLLEDRSL